MIPAQRTVVRHSIMVEASQEKTLMAVGVGLLLGAIVGALMPARAPKKSAA